MVCGAAHDVVVKLRALRCTRAPVAVVRLSDRGRCLVTVSLASDFLPEQARFMHEETRSVILYALPVVCSAPVSRAIVPAWSAQA